MTKAEGAFRTIGEVAAETGVAQHILRYWESRFPQLRPLQRAGNRRYYRQADVALVRRIDTLLNQQGYTIKGVQKMLADDAPVEAPSPAASRPIVSDPAASPPSPIDPVPEPVLPSPAMLEELRAIRDALAGALDADARQDVTG